MILNHCTWIFEAGYREIIAQRILVLMFMESNAFGF